MPATRMPVQNTTVPTPAAIDDAATGVSLPPWARSHWRAILTLGDQGLVSVGSFVTNFLLLNHFAFDKRHYAHYTLAFTLLIWVAEFQATLVFTPHTILSPRRSGDALRRLHGSTLIHHFAVSIVAMLALAAAAPLVYPYDPEMASVLLVLAGGTLAIGLRNYARPYSFTARQPGAAVLLDAAVCVLQIGGVMALAWADLLTASTAIAVLAAAAAVPAGAWLIAKRRAFSPSIPHAVADLRNEWPNTRWVLFSGVVWNAGMQLYPFLIAVLIGQIEVAVWGACYQLAAVANPLLMGMQNFIGPRIAEAYTERSGAGFARFVYRIAVVTALLMIGPAVLLSVFATSALAWISRGQYTGHQAAITFLCAAIVMQAITFTLSRGLFALGRADLDLYCNFGPLLLLFTGGTWLTLHYGTTGAAASMLIAQLLSSGSRAFVFAAAARGDRSPATVLDPATGLRGAV
ncbi:MAG TPA: hypothetical protein VF624_05415 [Tepidisphaeraceae bacterium]